MGINDMSQAGIERKLKIAEKSLGNFITDQLDQGASEAEMHLAFIALFKMEEILYGE